MKKALSLVAMALNLCLGDIAASQTVEIKPSGDVLVPSTVIPRSTLMSAEGNASRVEHILTERSLKGKSIAELNAALFGPRLEIAKARYAVDIREDRIGGVPVLVYEPRGGVAPKLRHKVLINVHGGGFVGCFRECGGLESVPVVAISGMRVISIDYRLAPAARFPAASEDVASVYREVLKTYRPKSIGLYGCSAGGILTSQALAWFQSHALPAPAAAGVFCAGGDTSMGGDSRYIGALLGDGELPPPTGSGQRLGYLAGTSATDANVNPTSSDDVLKHFPPTLVIAGTRDFAMSSAVHLHSRLVANGVDARLHMWEGGRHAFFYDTRVPEAREAFQVISDFFTANLK